MEFLLRSFGVLIPIGVMALPFAVLVWRLLTRRRTRTKPPREAAATAALDVSIGLLAGLVLALVAMPVPGSGALHLAPGTDLEIALADSESFWQVAANVLMLLPLGVLLPLRWRWWRPVGRLAGAALLASIAIELAQYLFAAGRVTSTDDVLLNTVGAAAGVTLTRSRAGLRLLDLDWLLARIAPPQRSTRMSIPGPIGRSAK
ncbi:VanZ family protein [Qaidamihabitans albus]|uniref:VanZ family protein n=1 Tax=Qaidamihabitans albus TaxID=2795733 RepID=UPI0018F1F998|nr:VanZ family protein [Qaidamihabitans albus]